MQPGLGAVHRQPLAQLSPLKVQSLESLGLVLVSRSSLQTSSLQ